MTLFQARDEQDVLDTVAWAVAEQNPLEVICGGMSGRRVGRRRRRQIFWRQPEHRGDTAVQGLAEQAGEGPRQGGGEQGQTKAPGIGQNRRQQRP